MKVTRTEANSVVTLELSGPIVETINFLELLGPPTPKMVINCKGITRINSIGVKAWIAYFQSCKAKQTELSFVECSMPIVEQVNLISNFNCGGTVESFYVPFFCKTCKKQLMALFTAEKIKETQPNVPDLKCSQCQGQAAFDDDFDEYFGFLARS